MKYLIGLVFILLGGNFCNGQLIKEHYLKKMLNGNWISDYNTLKINKDSIIDEYPNNENGTQLCSYEIHRIKNIADSIKNRSTGYAIAYSQCSGLPGEWDARIDMDLFQLCIIMKIDDSTLTLGGNVHRYYAGSDHLLFKTVNYHKAQK